MNRKSFVKTFADRDVRIRFDAFDELVKIENKHGDVIATVLPDDLFDFDGNRFEYGDD